MPTRSFLAALAIVAAAAGCRTTTPAADAPQPGLQPIPQTLSTPTAEDLRSALAARRQPYSRADVDFMQGMIPHHAQAILMCGFAPGSQAGPEILTMCDRIVVSQRDEIEEMRSWLRDRGEHVPAADATHHRMTMHGHEHDMLMPGMLSDAELAQLRSARGRDFDRMFLRFMIRHHEGALAMVEQLFASRGAAQDDAVYTFASDVFADQGSEIDRMQRVLEALDRRP